MNDQLIEVGEWLQQAWVSIREHVARLMEPQLSANWRMNERGEHRMHIERAVTSANTVFISSLGTEHALGAVIINVDVVFAYRFVEVTNEFFGDTGVSTARDPGNELPDLMVVQRPHGVLFEVVVLDDETSQT